MLDSRIRRLLDAYPAIFLACHRQHVREDEKGKGTPGSSERRRPNPPAGVSPFSLKSWSFLVGLVGRLPVGRVQGAVLAGNDFFGDVAGRGREDGAVGHFDFASVVVFEGDV